MSGTAADSSRLAKRLAKPTARSPEKSELNKISDCGAVVDYFRREQDAVPSGMSRGNKSSHGLVVFDGKSGAKLWTIITGEGGFVNSGVKGGITMSSNGTVFFGGLDNNLYCVGTGATGPADSSWPMLGGNAQNTDNVKK